MLSMTFWVNIHYGMYQWWKRINVSPTMADVILDVELTRFVSRMAFGLWLVDWSPNNLTINLNLLEFEYHGMEYQLRY